MRDALVIPAVLAAVGFLAIGIIIVVADLHERRRRSEIVRRIKARGPIKLCVLQPPRGLSMRDAYQRFHAQRRMFAIIGETLLIAPEHSIQTHAQWLTEIGLEGWVDKCTRGYYHLHSKVLAYYSGPTFDHTTADKANLFQVLDELVLALEIPSNTAVWAGVVPGPVPGDQWPPREVQGTVGSMTCRSS